MTVGYPQKVNFPSNGINIVGELYRPADDAPFRKKAAIVIGHPAYGVKEQIAALHAQALASAGFIALTFDAAYQGESGGAPRAIENPFQRAEDARAAVSYLSSISEVDEERIGALGLCASGGYVSFAAQTDTRMRAVATVSGADFGRLLREGLQPAGAVTREQLAGQLKGANEMRTLEFKEGEPRMAYFMPQNLEDLPTGQFWKEGWDYYRTPRGAHPRSTGAWAVRSLDLLANFDAFRFQDMISPRPLLMIAGSVADTRYFSEDAIATAKEPKELFLVEGKSHFGIYDDLSVTGPKLVNFFAKNLAG